MQHVEKNYYYLNDGQDTDRFSGHKSVNFQYIYIIYRKKLYYFWLFTFHVTHLNI